jgi:hypothetical protein
MFWYIYILKQNYQLQVDIKWIVIFHFKSWPFNFLHIIFRFVALMLLTENFQVRDLGQILVVYGYWAPANDKGQSTLDNTKQ